MCWRVAAVGTRRASIWPRYANRRATGLQANGSAARFGYDAVNFELHRKLALSLRLWRIAQQPDNQIEAFDHFGLLIVVLVADRLRALDAGIAGIVDAFEKPFAELAKRDRL